MDIRMFVCSHATNRCIKILCITPNLVFILKAVCSEFLKKRILFVVWTNVCMYLQMKLVKKNISGFNGVSVVFIIFYIETTCENFLRKKSCLLTIQLQEIKSYLLNRITFSFKNKYKYITQKCVYLCLNIWMKE